MRIEANTLKKRFNDGKSEGLAEGKAEGLSEGETKSKTEIAKKMLADGLDFSTIKKYTGLVDEVILDLDNE